MAVSIDARVGQREIDAAREAGADIEGVTSMQGTPVADVEEQITFGGYPNQIGPNQIGQSFLSRKGLLNKEPSHVDVIDIINSLHPDFVANASPAELDYAISVVQGKVDYDVIETVTPAVGAMKTMTKDIKALNEELDRRIAEITLANEQKKQEIKEETKRASVSPWKARTRMPDPIAPLGPYSTRKAFPSPLESSVPFVSDYQDAGMPNVGLPIDYAGIPTQGDPRFMTDVGARSSNVLGEVIASTGHPDWGMSGTPMNPPRMVTRPDGTVEMMEMPIMQSQVPLIDVPKDIKTTKKDTKKTNYGAWKGKFNNLTSKQNLKNLHTFQKARMSDFEKRFGSAKYFGLTRPTVNGKPIEWSENALRNKYMRTDQFSNDYNAVYGTSKVAKLVGGGLSKGVSLVGGGLQGFFNKKGVGNADTFDDVIRKVEAGEYEGQAEVPAPDPRDKVTGGFWGLMAFAKKHPKIFGPLSGDELWSLISDPDGFWEYYEAALEGD